MTVCKNCGNHFEGNYCNFCGQKADVKRFSWSHMTSVFMTGFFGEKTGLVNTIRQLFFHPGKMLRRYIEGQRVAHINPFSFLTLICLFGGFLYPHSGMVEHVGANIFASPETIRFTNEHYLYRMLFTIPVCTFLCWGVYRNYKYNLSEYFIINTFIMSQTILIMVTWMLALCFITLKDRDFEIVLLCVFLLNIIYPAIALANVFNSGNRAIRWIKAITVVLASFILSFVVINGLTRLFTFL